MDSEKQMSGRLRLFQHGGDDELLSQWTAKTDIYTLSHAKGLGSPTNQPTIFDLGSIEKI